MFTEGHLPRYNGIMSSFLLTNKKRTFSIIEYGSRKEIKQDLLEEM